MAQVHTAMYERTVKMFAMYDARANVHYCFATFQAVLKEARQQRELTKTRAAYERAVQAWVSSDVKLLLHYVSHRGMMCRGKLRGNSSSMLRRRERRYRMRCRSEP